jgi:hypothetical protein
VPPRSRSGPEAGTYSSAPASSPAGLTGDELAVDNYDGLTVSDVASAVQQLTDTAALTALLRYEQNHKDRAGAVTAIENRLAALVEQDISRN